MKKTLSLVILGLILGAFSNPSSTTAEEAKYKNEIQNCIKANREHKAKEIREYVCPVGKVTEQQIAFQVIMSLEFNKLDKKIESDLLALSKDTNKESALLAQKINDMFSVNGETNYPKQYYAVCDSKALDEVMKTFSGGITTETPVQDFVYGGSACKNLVNKKMESYRQSAWLLGATAVMNSFKNDKHAYMRKLKDKYEKFLNKWTIYIGQLSIIQNKWNAKSKRVQ